MVVDIDEQARELYLVTKDIEGFETVVDRERKKLAKEMVGGASRLEVTSFTLAGQSASGNITATRPEWLAVLNALHRMLTNNAIATIGRTQPSF